MSGHCNKQFSIEADPFGPPIIFALLFDSIFHFRHKVFITDEIFAHIKCRTVQSRGHLVFGCIVKKWEHLFIDFSPQKIYLEFRSGDYVLA